jgi:uncharacterized protein
MLLAVCNPVCLKAKDYTIETIPNVRLTDKYNHVSNPDGIISEPAAAAINTCLQELEDSTGIEVAVVAVESIGDNDAREFAVELFRHWGIGDKQKDNGLLIQLVAGTSQRSVVFETGYGMEGALPDAICYRLQQQYMIPDMRNGNYSSGMLKGVTAVKDYLLASDYERKIMTGGDREGKGFPWELLSGLLIFPLIFLMQWFKRRPRVCPQCGKRTLRYGGRQTVRPATYHSQGLAMDVWQCTNCKHTANKERILSRLSRNQGPIIGGGSGTGFGGGWGSFRGGGSWGGGRSGGGGSISRF